MITLTPEPVKDFAIRTFGENDKIALVVGTLVVIALYALVIGLVALRSRRLGAIGIALFGLVGALAAITRPAGGPLDMLPSLARRGGRHRRPAARSGPAHRRPGTAAAPPALRDAGAGRSADEGAGRPAARGARLR